MSKLDTDFYIYQALKALSNRPKEELRERLILAEMLVSQAIIKGVDINGTKLTENQIKTGQDMLEHIQPHIEYLTPRE